MCGETEANPRKICQYSQSHPKFEWSLLNACLEHCQYTSLLIVHGQFSPLLWSYSHLKCMNISSFCKGHIAVDVPLCSFSVCMHKQPGHVQMEVHFPIVLQLMHYAVRCACAISYCYFTEFAATFTRPYFTRFPYVVLC